MQRYFKGLGNYLDFICLFGMRGKNPRMSRNIPRLLPVYLDRVVTFTAAWRGDSSNREQPKERDRQRREEREKEGIKDENQIGRTLVCCVKS